MYCFSVFIVENSWFGSVQLVICLFFIEHNSNRICISCHCAYPVNVTTSRGPTFFKFNNFGNETISTVTDRFEHSRLQYNNSNHPATEWRNVRVREHISQNPSGRIHLSGNLHRNLSIRQVNFFNLSKSC